MSEYRIYIQKEVYETYDIKANSEKEALRNLHNAIKVGESGTMINKTVVNMNEIPKGK